MKTFKTVLAVITAALLPLVLLASPSSADIGVDDATPPTGVLKLVSQADNSIAVNPPYETGQQVRLYANFSGGVRNVTFYKVVGGTQTTIGTDEANTNGNAYLNYTIAAGAQDIYAEDVNDEETETDTYTGEAAPPPGGTLTRTDTLGKAWTAHFSPKASGQSTKLEIRRICTYETDETNPEPPAVFDPDVDQADCLGPWKSIATGTQDSNGDSKFTLPDKFEVEHVYRASSGTVKTNEVAFGPTLVEDNPYGISTGLSEVHFNTYEQASVDTRTHYFEGEFTMTASTKSVDPDAGGPATAAPCGAVAPLRESVMKGRGNYSWTFPKKSFTLKIAKKTDLCGMGKGSKWALVSNDYDKSLLRNSLAGYVGSKLNGMDWTPKSVPVDFYLNGSYRGSYLLIERIAITKPKDVAEGKDSPRLVLDELNGDDPEEQIEPKISGGYVLEWDFRKGADYNAYLGSDSGYVGVKEPENDYGRTGSGTGNGNNTGEGISSAQKTYISGFLNKVDNSLRAGPAWDTYIDRDSAVDYYIAMEYMKPVDGNMWASVYMYKPRGQEKLYFGPLWDFDLAAGSANRAGNVVSSSGFYLKNNLGVSAQQDTSSGKTWFNRLNEYPSFRTAVAQRWDAIKGDLQPTTYLNAQSSLIAQSAAANFNKWSSTSRISDVQVLKGSWSSDWTYLRTWASGRKTWLDGGSGF